MSEAGLRVLIVGGYGVFGGRLAQLLADDSRFVLIVAGRSKQKAQFFCDGLPAKAELIPAFFDRNAELDAQIKTFKPAIIVDASGPFQGYGNNPYKLVNAALARGIHYIDLADGSDFVVGIKQFDVAAKQKNIFILSGVSSFPVLTAAVVRHLSQDLSAVETITGGIAPSPYAGVGLNVIRAIASYAGKKVPLTRNGEPSFAYGLTETKRYTICPPGYLPLKSTLFSLVDVPDLQILPLQWPGLKSIWIGAGPVPVILLRGLNLLARGTRYRCLPSLSFLAPVFYWVINTLRWGEHRGGMYVSIDGKKGDGSTVTRSWHLLAEGDDGPFIPSMAVAAILFKCVNEKYPIAGARSAITEIELSDYEKIFSRHAIYSGCRESGVNQDSPLYQRVLGSAWDDLPPAIRAMHNLSSSRTAQGRADVERGSHLFSRLIGGLFRFPKQGNDIPLTVTFTADGQGEIWTRQFGDKSFSSYQVAGKGRSDKLLNESFGPFFFGLALVVSEGRLSLVIRRWTLLGIPLPLFLAPFGDSFEYVKNDCFHFNVEIRIRLIGLIVRYRGHLTLTD
ncbi:DUF4166 domain-containing protein [Gammaproteobacteria bacterium]|nr:DUF4166 domain-containing protein [Gammaproteobacteria bacterium]